MNSSTNYNKDQLKSTGHGTVDIPWSESSKESMQVRSEDLHKHNKHEDNVTKDTNERQPDSKNHAGFGHTVSHQHSPRSIKRDLDNV
ncbi:hypothetical protein BDF20DRAFT_912226 [Mycotypha africana]|uniref:uncharacterized protein n=1 Tax=Mycotypha africana TaxID=64632 RepID=UPI002301EDAF|nr:uncharacterized protein BDF20DRAFT_912226 [Mycotypha africana]KAI8982021.1 hypothetical protein BDF20DRAFT_912226 [Mycotypha africana]